MFRVRRWNEVEDEAPAVQYHISSRLRVRRFLGGHLPHVEDVNQRHYPFEVGRNVVVVQFRGHAETNHESYLDEDECKLNPERDSKDSILPVVNTKTLIFGAYKDRGNNITQTGRLLASICLPQLAGWHAHMKTPRQMSCILSWFLMLYIVSRISPIAPTIAAIIAQMLKNASFFV